MDMKERREKMFAELAMARHFTESDVAVTAVNHVESLLRETPVRECDVGTPEEQLERFEEFCGTNVCGFCRYRSAPDTRSCLVNWMLGPRNAEGGEE